MWSNIISFWEPKKYHHTTMVLKKRTVYLKKACSQNCWALIMKTHYQSLGDRSIWDSNGYYGLGLLNPHVYGTHENSGHIYRMNHMWSSLTDRCPAHRIYLRRQTIKIRICLEFFRTVLSTVATRNAKFVIWHPCHYLSICVVYFFLYNSVVGLIYFLC